MSITLVFPVGYKPVLKHAEHEQSDHGNREGGGSADSVSNSMPYTWSPKVKAPSDTQTELEKFEYQKGKTNLQEVAKSPTAIRLYERELEGILQIGRFQTLEEQPDLDIANDDYRQARQELEVGLWGVPEGDTGPIYGYIDTPLQPSLDNDTRNYGEVKVILKDSVAARTTITAGDSANRGLTPVLLKDAREGSLTSEQVDSAYRSRAFQSGATTVSSPQIIVGGHSNIDYYEAQIHGGISLKDIQSVFISKDSAIKDGIISSLESKGIKVNRG